MDLDKAIQQLFSAGIAHSIHCSYQSGALRYLQFCHLYNIIFPHPVEEKSLMQFVTYLLKSCQGVQSRVILLQSGTLRYL